MACSRPIIVGVVSVCMVQVLESKRTLLVSIYDSSIFVDFIIKTNRNIEDELTSSNCKIFSNKLLCHGFSQSLTELHVRVMANNVQTAYIWIQRLQS